MTPCSGGTARLPEPEPGFLYIVGSEDLKAWVIYVRQFSGQEVDDEGRHGPFVEVSNFCYLFWARCPFTPLESDPKWDRRLVRWLRQGRPERRIQPSLGPVTPIAVRSRPGHQGPRLRQVCPDGGQDIVQRRTTHTLGSFLSYYETNPSELRLPSSRPPMRLAAFPLPVPDCV